MADEILPIPPIPDGLREAAQRGTLIPFVGAGASRLAGCPGWNEFADGALSFFVDQGKFSHGQLAQIRHLNPRVKLSLALGLQREHQIRIDFRKLLHPNGRENYPNGRRLYSSLSKLGKTFVTTNYDEWLDEEIAVPDLAPNPDGTPEALPRLKGRTVIHAVKDLIYANLNRPDTVIHLHGSVLNPEGMVLTTQDYVHLYANDRLRGETGQENVILTFLEALFQHKTVLFIGYGLEELEILEYVISKARQIRERTSKEVNHYLVQGFFSHEYEVMRSLRQYYKAECGIHLLPFLRDLKDWNQLLDVVDEYARSVPASTPMVVQEFQDMKELLK